MKHQQPGTFLSLTEVTEVTEVTESSEISMLRKGLSRCALMKGSLKRSMGKPLRDKNKLAYFGPERLPGRPDGDSAGRLQCRAFKRSHQIPNQVPL